MYGGTDIVSSRLEIPRISHAHPSQCPFVTVSRKSMVASTLFFGSLEIATLFSLLLKKARVPYSDEDLEYRFFHATCNNVSAL